MKRIIRHVLDVINVNALVVHFMVKHPVSCFYMSHSLKDCLSQGPVHKVRHCYIELVTVFHKKHLRFKRRAEKMF